MSGPIVIGDHVDIIEFTRHGDHKDSRTLNGWVTELSDTIITISAWPLEPGDDAEAFLATFPLTGKNRVEVISTAKHHAST